MKKISILLITLLFLIGCTSQSSTITIPYNVNDNLQIQVQEFKNALLIQRIIPKSKKVCKISKNFVNKFELDIDTSATLLINKEEQELIYNKNAKKKLYPASLTKIMTALIVLEHGNINKPITINKDIGNLQSGAKIVGLKTGDVITLRQLLHGLLITSGNDCGIAIANHISGSVEKFSELMNKRAKELGAKNTNFENPHGLFSKNHYSTAYDLYLIFNEVIKHPLFKEIVNKKSFVMEYKNKDGSLINKTIITTNLYFSNNFNLDNNVTAWGGKTGFISEVGYNLILLSNYKEKQFISVIIGAKTKNDLYLNMSSLLNNGVKIIE